MKVGVFSVDFKLWRGPDLNLVNFSAPIHAHHIILSAAMTDRKKTKIIMVGLFELKLLTQALKKYTNAVAKIL